MVPKWSGNTNRPLPFLSFHKMPYKIRKRKYSYKGLTNPYSFSKRFKRKRWAGRLKRTYRKARWSQRMKSYAKGRAIMRKLPTHVRRAIYSYIK